MATPPPPFPLQPSSMPTFGANRGVPFMFYQPAPSSTHPPPWDPSTSPRTIPHDSSAGLNDVTMQDASPPKVEIPSTTPTVRTVATGAMTRVFRAREKQRERSRRRGGHKKRVDTDEDEDEGTDDDGLSENDQLQDLVRVPRRRTGLQKSHSDPVTATTNYNHHYTLHVPTPPLSHSEIPYMLLGYLRFFFNSSLAVGLLYLLFCFVRAVQKDVEQKMAERTLETLQDIKACASLFTDNFCSEKPSPIIMHKCHEWKACMERDASVVGRTRLLAELIGEVINDFMEPITWRTMLFTTTSLAMGIAFINTLLMFYRARFAPAAHDQPAHFSTPVPSFPIYNGNQPPSYWGQPPPSTVSHMIKDSGQESDVRRAWSTPPEEDTLESPSRRRKLSERDAVKVR